MRFLTSLFVTLFLLLVTAGVLHTMGVTEDQAISFAQNVWNHPAEFFSRSTPIADTEQQEEKPQNLSYTDRMTRGKSYAKEQFWGLAANEFVQAARIEPKKAEPYSWLGQMAMALRDWPKAKANFAQALNLEPNTQYALAGMAHVLLVEGNMDQAKLFFQNIPQPFSPQVSLQYSIYLGFSGDPEGAKNALETAKFGDADVAQKAEKLLAAYREFALYQDGKEIHRQALLARTFSNIGYTDLSIAQLKKILVAMPNYRDAWIILGYDYLSIEEYSSAMQAFQKAYSIDPIKPEASYYIGLTSLKMGNFPDAIKFLSIAIQNGYEPLVQAKQTLAEAYFKSGDSKNSAALYKEILSSSTQETGGFVRPIWLYIEQLHDPKSAVKLASQAVATTPNDPVALSLLGWALWADHSYADAEKALLQSIQLNPNLAAAHLNLGRVYESTNRTDQALSEYEKAYQLDQNGSIGVEATKRYNLLLKK